MTGINALTFLTHVARHIRVDGKFITRGAVRDSGGYSTSDLALADLTGDPIPANPEDIIVAAAAFSFAKEARGNDFLDKLAKVASRRTLVAKNAGILAAAVSCYLREKVKAEAPVEPEKPAEVKIPIPFGDKRHAIEGVVVSRKIHESSFGSAWKLTIKVEAPEGVWLCWGTEPSAVTCAKGDRVRFDARLIASDRDESFGFFKRPTNFVNLSAPAAVDSGSCPGHDEEGAGLTVYCNATCSHIVP